MTDEPPAASANRPLCLVAAGATLLLALSACHVANSSATVPRLSAAFAVEFPTPISGDSTWKREVTGLTFSPTGATLAIGYADGTVLFVDAATGQQQLLLSPVDDGWAPASVVYHPRRPSMIVAREQDDWWPADDEFPAPIRKRLAVRFGTYLPSPTEGEFWRLAEGYHATDGDAALRTGQKTFDIHTAPGGRLIASLPAFPRGATPAGSSTRQPMLERAELSPDGSRLLLSVYDFDDEAPSSHRVLLWRVPDWELLDVFPGRDAHFVSDGAAVLYRTGPRMLRCLTIAGASKNSEWKPESADECWLHATSPDGTRFVTSLVDMPIIDHVDDEMTPPTGTLQLRRLRFWSPVATLSDAPTEPPTRVTFAPDGRRVAVGNRTGTVRVWQVP